MLLVSGQAYPSERPSSGALSTVVCMTTLAGGTATFQVTDELKVNWVTVISLTDVPEQVNVPATGYWRVNLTGSAVVNATAG